MNKVERVTRLNVEIPQWTVVAKILELLAAARRELVTWRIWGRHGPLNWAGGACPGIYSVH